MKYTNEQLIDELRRFVIENGRPPTKREFDKKGPWPSLSVYKKRFGSWGAALKAAEIEAAQEYLDTPDGDRVLVVNSRNGDPVNTRAPIDRNSPEMRAWKEQVLEQGGYECKGCGSTEGLEAHHVFPLLFWPERGVDVDNGMVLCRQCHTRIHHCS